MNCIYIEDLKEENNILKIPEAEAKHLKALHLKPNEKILITNGKGLIAIAEIEITNKNCSAKIDKFVENFNELDFRLGIAIGILDNKDRFEFALEKCTELGISDFFPIISDFSQFNPQKQKFNKERLISKSIAAIKQCKRSKLPIIHNPLKLEDLLSKISSENEFQNIILADENGEKPQINSENFKNTKANNNKKNKKNSIVFVGPEGGFSEKELDLFPQNTIKWNLGNRRLRAESAAILSIGILSL